MTTATLTCEQAIFTSIRSRMGEGYRIVAASRGLSIQDKQTITRNSPSHESLCNPQSPGREQEPAVSFYSLPSERLCVAISYPAGAEHTGRGGDRVYTHCVAFPADQFAAADFNPFTIVRAMCAAGLNKPQLKPQPMLSVLELTVERGGTPVSASWKKVPPQHRARALACLLEKRPAIVELQGEWGSCAEAALLGVPGPLRGKLSFSAGMKFSSARRHDLQLLRDEKNQLKNRLSGQPLTIIDPGEAGTPLGGESAWCGFVERLWSRGDLRELARRTSRAMVECRPEGMERVGALYNLMDALPQQQPQQVLALAAGVLDSPLAGAEPAISAELLEKANQAFLDKLTRITWGQAVECWRPLVALWRRSSAAAEFAAPLLERMLRLASAESPVTAAEAALMLENEPQPQSYRTGLRPIVDGILRRLGDTLRREGSSATDRGEVVAARWARVRPNCEIAQGLCVPAGSAQ